MNTKREKIHQKRGKERGREKERVLAREGKMKKIQQMRLKVRH